LTNSSVSAVPSNLHSMVLTLSSASQLLQRLFTEMLSALHLAAVSNSATLQLDAKIQLVSRTLTRLVLLLRLMLEPTTRTLPPLETGLLKTLFLLLQPLLVALLRLTSTSAANTPLWLATTLHQPTKPTWESGTDVTTSNKALSLQRPRLLQLFKLASQSLNSSGC